MFAFLRRLRRASVLEAPFPEELRPVLETQVALYTHLTPVEREKLERLTLLFLHEKKFEAAGGLVLSDVMQAVIAARAELPRIIAIRTRIASITRTRRRAEPRYRVRR